LNLQTPVAMRGLPTEAGGGDRGPAEAVPAIIRRVKWHDCQAQSTRSRRGVQLMDREQLLGIRMLEREAQFLTGNTWR
jgi:hypothetical protein